MKKVIRTFIYLLTIAPVAASAQTNSTPTNYLKVAGPILFEKQAYHLAWTSHPATNFYKQEYIRKGDVITKFKTMILLDVIAGDDNIREIVGAKIAELKKMKEVNPMVNYDILENRNSQEYILDFLVSQSSPDGISLSIVERNIYRYKIITDKSGKKAVLLFGVSTRSYGSDIDNFLTALKTKRSQLIQSVSEFDLPKISISN